MRTKYNEIAKVLRKHEEELISKCKINQLGIGYKVKDRKMKRRIAILAFVTKKFSDKQLLSEQIEPVKKKYDGYETDVIEIPGGINPRVVNEGDYGKHRPIMGGHAMIHEKDSGSGTIGIILYKKGSMNNFYILTNNHVGANEDLEGLFSKKADEGNYWFQPGTHGGGLTDKNNRVARLIKWNRIKPAAPEKYNSYDVAVGRIQHNIIKKAEFISYKIEQIGKVYGIEDTELGDLVLKRGCASELTKGIVSGFIPKPQTITINYSGYACDFTDQIIITGDPPSKPFSKGGDSGSLVVSEKKDPIKKSHKAKALLFAGGKSSSGIDYSFANPITKIAEDFKLEFYPKSRFL